MALMYSEMIPIGTPAPPFSLKGVDNEIHTLDSYGNSKLLVVVFMCNHCPYVIACQDRLIAIQKDYQDRGVTLIGINPNDSEKYPDDSFEAMKQRSDELNYNFDYLVDETQETARSYSAVCTPDIFVFDQNRTLQYRGRIDDNWKEPQNVTQKDLRHALDDLLEGQAIDWKQEPSMGCSIKWRDS